METNTQRLERLIEYHGRQARAFNAYHMFDIANNHLQAVDRCQKELDEVPEDQSDLEDEVRQREQEEWDALSEDY